MNETTGLRILLASGAALIVIAAAPTGAVDYAQCEAMMKIYTSIEVAKNEAMEKAYWKWTRDAGGMEYERQIKIAQEKEKAAKPYNARLLKILMDYQKSGCP